MAFFKFRKGGDSIATPVQPESVEAMRRRARHRLIGAAVLVLAGVIGFPLLFDTQPRPIALDIPIDIPDRNKTKPLALPAAAGPVTSAPETAVPPDAPAPVAAAPAAAPAQASAAAPVTPARPEPKPAAPDDSTRAKALLEGQGAHAAAPTGAASAAAADGRFVVQVGAFADVMKARDARARLEKAGLKTYTHVAETKDGKRIRVRVGPFPTRGEADKAAQKVKGLDLPAAVLTL
ncbi:MAG TPA: SPOR domain-containing protein [Ramlibacter sp.]|nr:SPOR domain-containing protein [Ramlibacter sp.]